MPQWGLGPHWELWEGWRRRGRGTPDHEARDWPVQHDLSVCGVDLDTHGVVDGGRPSVGRNPETAPVLLSVPLQCHRLLALGPPNDGPDGAEVLALAQGHREGDISAIIAQLGRCHLRLGDGRDGRAGGGPS